jgi:hypothetical protein
MRSERAMRRQGSRPSEGLHAFEFAGTEINKKKEKKYLKAI